MVFFIRRSLISPFGRMEDMLARAHTAADNAGLQIFVEQAYWFPSLQDLNELIEQVADDAARYQHNQVQLQHSVWLRSQPPGYESDEDVPDVMTQVTAVERIQVPSLASYAPTNTIMAQPRYALAAEPMGVQVVVIVTMVAYATWTIMGLMHNHSEQASLRLHQ